MALRDYKSVSVGELAMYEANSRTHSVEQIEKIVRSIKEFGFTLRVWYNVYISSGVNRCIKLFLNIHCMKYQPMVR